MAVDKMPSKRPLAEDGVGPMYAFTATVGRKPSHASNYLHDAWDVATLLVRLSGEQMPSLRSDSFDCVNDAGAYFFA